MTKTKINKTKISSKGTFSKYKKYLKSHPEIDRILKQLRIDEESYFKALESINNTKIVPRSTLSNKTY